MKKSLLAFCCFLLFAAVAVYAETPAQNINPDKHPNLAKAQTDLNLAYQKIVDAQKANEFDLGGHADKAKQLLQQASDHLKQAALAANQNPNTSSPMAANRPEQAPPEATVSASKHGNLAKAQEYIQSAYSSIIAAQKANEYDLGGHAAKAKSVLEDAQKELKLAAEAASKK
jgi:hypothetical protein